MLEVFTGLAFDIKSEQDITHGDLAQFAVFVREEKETFFALLRDARNYPTPAVLEQGGALQNHTWAHQRIIWTGKDHETSSRFIFARDPKGNLIGYSISSLYSLSSNPNVRETELSFLGVKSKYHHLGIGTMLLQKTHKVFVNMGITEYVANAHPRVVRILNSLGACYLTRTLPGIDPGRKHVRVFLK